MKSPRRRPASDSLRPFLGAVALACSLLGGRVTAEEPRLALLLTQANGPETTVVLATPGQPLPPPVARLHHLPDAAVRGVLLAGRNAAAVVADAAPGRDRSWGSTLFLAAWGLPPKPLCDRVAYAGRPLVTAEGHLVVARGEPGVALPGEMRVDALRVDEVDPDTGSIRALFAATGFAAFPAALHGREVLVYVVEPGEARLVAVDRLDGRVRVVLPSLAPFARDFTASPDGRLVFANRDAARPGFWVVESVDLATGELRRLHSSRFSSLAPHAWPEGSVTWNGERGDGLSGTRRPLGVSALPGLIEVVATSRDGGLAAAHLVRAGSSAVEAALVDRDGKLLGSVRPPAGARLEVLGLLP